MKKMNNKGFSLVELIIVIAIMAILIAVLAPQYIKYVEKSRKSADLDNWQAIVDAIQVAYADVESPLTGSNTISFPGKNQAPTCSSALSSALSDLGVDTTTMRMKSSAYSNASLSATESSGVCTITLTGPAELKSSLGLK